ncbi:MAG: alpha-glucosidase/alpha-galactosidase, partial [Treponemataceae bacterium]|nr:alpha-glucosidase/alpha-galactosidase [Treponemataceae bacterium]
MSQNPQNLKICYIGGGSRNWAWVFMRDLTYERELGGTIYLYDIDTEAARANEIIGNRLMEEHNRGQWKFRAEPSLERALEGADFVLISILPGDFSEMEVDVHEPERYGIYQSVGDTTGPGGLMRALRTIPQYQRLAQAIKQAAPDA